MIRKHNGPVRDKDGNRIDKDECFMELVCDHCLLPFTDKDTGVSAVADDWDVLYDVGQIAEDNGWTLDHGFAMCPACRDRLSGSKCK